MDREDCRDIKDRQNGKDHPRGVYSSRRFRKSEELVKYSKRESVGSDLPFPKTKDAE